MGTIGAIFGDLERTPLGLANGEANLQTPFNSTPVQTIVRVRNLSATIPRRVVKTYVSDRRGGEKLAKSNNLSMTEIHEMAKSQDMNEYKTVTKPIKTALTHDNRTFVIPPATSKDEEPPWVIVPEGMWDLYLGNYQRMHGTPQERSDEASRLAGRFQGRENPVLRRNAATGEPMSGYIEFTREDVMPEQHAIDSNELRVGEIVEV